MHSLPYPVASLGRVIMAAVAVVLVASHARSADTLASVEAYFEEAIAQWDVPGLALAVVKGDEVVMARGFGVRERGKDEAVDENTLFAIGSASKAFTAAALAMLVDEGKLGWDDPATKHLPGFQLFDPAVTRELTVRDLLCHRSGLPRGDLLWYATPYRRDEILRRVGRLEPEWSFRSHFGYQNIMYLAAGQIVPRATDLSWDDFVKQRVFLPLGMKSTVTSVKALESLENVATPHAKIDGDVEAVAWRDIDNVGPAGSIISNVSDMAQWVRLQLGEGAVGDRRLISTAALAEMQAPQTIIQSEEYYRAIYPEAHFLCYGLGWFLHDYAGRKIVEHGGAIDGMRAKVAMIPEEELGVVILTNAERSRLPTALMFYIFDLYLKPEPRDWSSEFLSLAQEAEKQAEEAKAKRRAERAENTEPSLPLEAYAGAYENDLYGEVNVQLEIDHLVLDTFSVLNADLEHWHYDTFLSRYRDRGIEPRLITFHLNTSGKVESLVMPDVGTFSRVANSAEDSQ